MPYLAIIQIQIKAKGIVEYVDPSILLRDNSVIGFQHQDKTACSQLNQLSNLRSSPTDDVPANVVENERKISIVELMCWHVLAVSQIICED